MKLGGKPAANASPVSPAPAAAPEIPTDSAPVDQAPADEKPFDDQPFDAGVEADENTDPKKFIEQLTGKLGQSLRKYTQQQGNPDFALEKFAINSVLAASHTNEMDQEDKDDIIKKVESGGDKGSESGNNGGEDKAPDLGNNGDNEAGNEPEMDNPDEMNEGGILDEMSLNDHNAKRLLDIFNSGSFEVKRFLMRMVSLTDKIDLKTFIEDLQTGVDYEEIKFLFKELKNKFSISEAELKAEPLMLKNPKKNNMFQKGSNDVLEQNSCQKGYKQLGFKEKDGKNVPNCVQENAIIKRKIGIFGDKEAIKAKIRETLNQEDNMEAPVREPIKKPVTKPETAPVRQPTRKDRPFLPHVNPDVRPAPKAIK